MNLFTYILLSFTIAFGNSTHNEQEKYPPSDSLVPGRNHQDQEMPESRTHGHGNGHGGHGWGFGFGILGGSGLLVPAVLGHAMSVKLRTILPFMKVKKIVPFANPDASAIIRPGTSRKVKGKLIFFNENSGVRILGEVQGLSPGGHGIHVHHSGTLGNQCSSSGAHFNPSSSFHGGPSSSIRHVGDLGNIVANRNGVAIVDIFDRLISLDQNSRNYIGGRSIVIHNKEDDLGMGGANDPTSLISGNSGPRVGCGVIVREFTRHF